MANGTAYGYLDLLSMFSQRVVDVGFPVIQTAIVKSLERHTQIINSLTAQLVTPMRGAQDFKRRYQLPSSGSLQPLDAKGNPLVVKPSGFYDVALPIMGAGHAWGDDRILRAQLTVEDANRFTWDAMDRDTDWMRRHILSALLTNVTWTFPDPAQGDLIIQPLANGDAVIYGLTGGSSATDTHFLFQAAAISDAANPFPTLYRELAEHPSNSGPYVAYVATNLVTAVNTLAALIEPGDPRIVLGSGITTQVRNVNFDVTDADLTGFGDRYLGRANGVEIYEWSTLPDNIILIHASGVNDVLGMREYPQPELQGYFPEFNDVNGNLFEHRMLRFCGFGALNRVGAAVMLIGAGSYSVPTGYAAPLPA